jgi:hypothetical protein
MQQSHFDHNFGHGDKHLSTVLAYLMMLAFTIDQLQQTACKAFKMALEKCYNSKKMLWERLRSLFTEVPIDSWDTMFNLLHGKSRLIAVPNTS